MAQMADVAKGDGDYNNSGDVGGIDFLGWQQNNRISTGLAAARAAVPEPSSLMLLLAGTVGLASSAANCGPLRCTRT